MDKITSIYANGCSFTEGCELFSCKYKNFDRKVQSYSIRNLRNIGFNEFADFNYNNNYVALIANKLSVPFINESYSGNYNQNIVNTTVKHLNKIRNNPNKTLFILGLSDINRLFCVSEHGINYLNRHISISNKKLKLINSVYELSLNNYLLINLINK